MAVAAGVIGVEAVLTGIAIVDVSAHRLCAAAEDIVQRFFVAGEHAVAVLRLVGWSVFAEDVG
jgi:hypothetical protein